MVQKTSQIVAYESWDDKYSRSEITELYNHFIKEFKSIDFKQFTKEELLEFDFGNWDDNLILMPIWALDCLSLGDVVYSISDEETIVTEDTKLDKEVRFGSTAYGFNISQLRDAKIKSVIG